MKRMFLGIATGLLLLPGVALAADGKKVFDDGGCTLCHKPKEETIGPALTKIAATYASKKDDLVRFLSEEGQPIVYPDKFAIMKPNLLKTKALSKEDRSALADYILSQK